MFLLYEQDDGSAGCIKMQSVRFVLSEVESFGLSKIGRSNKTKKQSTNLDTAVRDYIACLRNSGENCFCKSKITFENLKDWHSF